VWKKQKEVKIVTGKKCKIAVKEVGNGSGGIDEKLALKSVALYVNL
jgi:hypothetical protein